MLRTHSSRRLLQTAASFLLLGGSLLLAAPSVRAQGTITDLYNTGVDGSGTLLNLGDLDTHYTQNSGNAFDPATFVVNNGVYAQNPISNYIAIDPVDGDGTYVVNFRTAFTLPANADLATVLITGNWAVDNAVNDLLINGVSTGLTKGDFDNFDAFILPTGSYVTGVNTLDFVMENQGGPGALNVYFTDRSFAFAGPTAVTPEPGALGLMVGAGMTGAGFAVRRKRRRRSA